MSKRGNQPPAEESKSVAIDGVGLVLSKEDTKRLAGYFDVLIQMDLEQKAKERIKDEEAKSNGSDQTHGSGRGT